MNEFEDFMGKLKKRLYPEDATKKKKRGDPEDVVVEYEPDRSYKQMLKELPEEYKDKINRT